MQLYAPCYPEEAVLGTARCGADITSRAKARVGLGNWEKGRKFAD